MPGLPDVDLDEGFAGGGWKTTALDACSMLVDGAPGETSQGFASGGKPTASMRLLLSGDTLYAEVTDDVFVTRGKVVDTLDVGSWFTFEMTGDRGQEHHRVHMDGQFSDGFGKRGRVDVAIAGGTRRFALPAKWVNDHEEWAVVYQDTDDGQTFASQLSTGPHDMAPPLFEAPRACVVRWQSLRVVSTQVMDAGTPLFP